jgi:hypothetical protein
VSARSVLAALAVLLAVPAAAGADHRIVVPVASS